MRHGMGETTYAHIRAEFGSRQERGDFLRLESPKHATGRSFSTPESISNERANIAHVMRGQQTQDPMMSEELAAAQGSRKSFLNSAQRTVIQEVLTSPDRIHGLQGLAGTGKTTVLSRASVKEPNIAAMPSRDSPPHLGQRPSSAKPELARPPSKASSPEAAKARSRAILPGRHLYLLDEGRVRRHQADAGIPRQDPAAGSCARYRG